MEAQSHFRQLLNSYLFTKFSQADADRMIVQLGEKLVEASEFGTVTLIKTYQAMPGELEMLMRDLFSIE